jgi:peptidoglycan/xylan/chitin deacetylase (PgdA/CDA1 family)
LTRNLAYRALRSGWAAARSLRNRVCNVIDPPVLVLVLHRVTALAADPLQLAVSPENFHAQLKYLKTNFPIIRFEEDWTNVREPSVVVTFDDGYADNAKQALPILEELEIPATLFVSSGTIDTRREFWWDELERVILLLEGNHAPFELKDLRYGRTWAVNSIAQREILYRDLHALISKVRPERREEWLGQLRSWAGLDHTGREANRPLTSKELETLAASRWTTIGAHSVTHTPLSVLSEEEQRHEILASKGKLEQLIGGEIKVFSYPFGRKVDYNRTSVNICREAGFQKAAANFPGQAHRWTDPWQIPRQLVRNWDGETFAAKIRGFWS